ncbi:hypothetical protein A2210_01885 [Candidatus Woesebacteria bacterium RIFOXYA1_FULL_40_18]|uniref:Uncharacterized protein n=3 Tax=Candidatus Woeseibacteriota TaxID=1752722 RepID=A0A0G0SKV4_9BACT|nr:MAG: hypothetical protein UU03_C0017G0007 [Candidatus Woesebacteria bacterium GW2011_GWA1_40_45]OGM75797.1 MAG: hypothetical protein A2210_01885 [Candidatus Woesebacteria bacterium RIFOXYA1_FULL_40_18]OGM87814.1 MAG: hypothetical protein A2614_00030 [Candidatus Woesebacteria bacterium RIFOXYD1_FULL_40_21]
MSPKSKRKKIVIDKVLAEIDQRPFIQTLTTIVSEVSPSTNLARVNSVLKYAVRCACLLDLYAETANPVYAEELQKQRSMFYEEVPEGFHSELEKVEDSVKSFFDYEKTLISRIKSGDKFSENDIKTYLAGKSGDNLFYGRLLELLVPEWKLTRELQIQTILFDIGKDLADYREDVVNGLPNVLVMCLSSRIDRGRIIQLAQELKDEALASQNIAASPTLVKAIGHNCNLIVERVNKS